MYVLLALRADAHLGAFPGPGGVLRRVAVSDVFDLFQRDDMRGVSGDDHGESSVGIPSGRHQHPAVIVNGQCAETLVAKKRRLRLWVAGAQLTLI